MLIHTLNVAAFAALAMASPAIFPPFPQPQGQYIDANYDDLTVVPAVPAANNNFKTYRGLNYTGFATEQPGIAGQAAVIQIHSNPNCIVTGFEQTALAGANAGWSVASPTSTFDQLGFYFVCAVNTVEGAEGVPQQCTIDVKGYRRLGDQDYVAIKQFSHAPKPGQVPAQQVLATFDGAFKDLQRIEVVMIESASGETGNVILIDDNMYRLFANRKY